MVNPDAELDRLGLEATKVIREIEALCRPIVGRLPRDEEFERRYLRKVSDSMYAPATSFERRLDRFEEALRGVTRRLLVIEREARKKNRAGPSASKKG